MAKTRDAPHPELVPDKETKNFMSRQEIDGIRSELQDLRPVKPMKFFLAKVFCRCQSESKRYQRILERAKTRIDKELDLRKFILR